MSFKIKLSLICLFFSFASCKLSEFVKWQSISYKNLPESTPYNAYVNVPFGVAHYKNKLNDNKFKLFVALPRRNPGVSSTLNVVELTGSPPHRNPKLIPYPSYQVTTLDPMNRANPSKIVSVYRPRVDNCDRLWFVDTGVLEYTDNQINVQRPSIWAIDLKTDQVIGRFEIPSDVIPDGKGLAAITIDDDDCENSFAYIPDWFNNALIVFSAKENKAWRFNSAYFHFNPFEADFDVDGLQFQWTDGIFSVALSTTKPDGFRTAFFHPLASTGEFTVSTRVLRNETNSMRRVHGNDFKFLGHGALRSQRGSHFYDPKHNVIFFGQMQNNAVSCWRIDEPFKPSNIHTIAENNSTLIYPVDLEIDNDSTLWVLSNRLPRFIYDRYDTNEFNFNIFRGNTDAVLAGTSCLV